MSSSIGPVAFQGSEGLRRRAGDPAGSGWSEVATARIEGEVQALLTRAFEAAVQTLSVRRAALDDLADALLMQGSLDRDEFLRLLERTA
jgi:ATP-dependent Zn protease